MDEMKIMILICIELAYYCSLARTNGYITTIPRINSIRLIPI